MSFHPSDSTTPNVFYSRSLHAFRSCVQCSSSAPACPTCDDGYTCTMISQSCTQCATTKCVKAATSGDSGSSSNNSGGGGGTDAGAIAGGVVGGVAFIAIVTFLVWWFFIRKKRKEQQASEAEKSSVAADTTRQSRKSTNSIASTVLTRASNVIQIAYIPGVTNRSPRETPGSLVPPVPPLPGAHPDQHFFMPGDLRDSTWSDMSNERRSIAPSLRSSVATTIYRNNAIVSPMPAQQVMRTRAAVVNINGTSADAPAVPAITQAQLAKANLSAAATNSSIVARTVTAKPVMVRGSSKKKKEATTTPSGVPTIAEKSESTSSNVSRSASTKQTDTTPTSGFDASSSDEEDTKRSSQARRVSATEAAKTDTQSRPATVIEDSPAVSQSPFQDQPGAEAGARTSSLLETPEGIRSNRSSRHIPPRVESPFSDANEVK
ncbi:uncharacterized protein BP01DRAFT_376268 [Aspergillus saccharolyticus JOP 1030-1]|uniref:Membrane anchor Opy2 N-terminal domain-containing protein n=1 Tax=Aspergillus saccharolyticus JOP 1030-1 TaxID=1450539 RepID=A0A318ZFJ8_9EURO|nr:hypothetical protein BP01DRAFT_376268 [Aspergillus saccharolyticus JOP 1030-1]PYH42390.1 hypothetical protein BP01DRAFT_376268 [Aspergillus saccharolyticus JOP 1030-1]